ncbi:MAG: hypothetical protein GX117_10960 [Candidatus Hydrogenedentes bacterium]|jgi:hypothetical protein|nr:hypothetical protein [Candidatus Hydrogenedentota bacterium]
MRQVVFVLLLSMSAILAFQVSAQAEWYKGAIHVHSLRSDGDGAPEVPVAWYKDHGWNFVCVTEHNQKQDDERFRPITPEKQPAPAQVKILRDQFGDDWVETKVENGQEMLRLKTYDEMKAHFEEEGEFLLIHGEEITSLGKGPHVCALNIVDVIPADRDKDAVTLARMYHNAVTEQCAAKNQPMIAVLNHPNFAESVTIEEILELKEYRLFEVFNGHPGVNNWGHVENGYPSTDRIWDVVLSFRLMEDKTNVLYGLASDDTHNYINWGTGNANPGRGWLMVDADSLQADALLEAIEAGKCYPSTGIVLDAIESSDTGLSFSIQAESGVKYTTRFIGSRKGFSTKTTPYLDKKGKTPSRASLVYDDSIGVVLAETTDLNPSYRFEGDELYVRAAIVSDKLHPNAFAKGDYEMAWVQPVVAP